MSPDGLNPFGNSAFGVAFWVAGLEIRWYAIFTLIGYASAIVIYLIAIKWRYKVAVDPAFYFIFIGIPMILLGARLWSFLMGNNANANGVTDWSTFFDFKTGGMAVQGGVVFGMLSAIIFFWLILKNEKYHKRVIEDGKVYIRRPSLWVYADAMIPTILFGQAIGRWGNFFNGELFGTASTPEDLHWLKTLMPGVYDGMIAHTTQTAVGLDPNQNIINGVIYQPLFLYSSFAGIISFCILYFLLPWNRKIKIGVVSGMYFVLYGITRSILESQRFHLFKFEGTFILNGFLMAIGLLLVIYSQFIADKLRDYKLFEIFKQWLVDNVEKRKFKEIFFDSRNLRKNSEKIFYARR